MNMPVLSIIFGLLLDVLGIAGYIGTGSTHNTALIPSVFGVVLFLCGLVSAFNPQIRMHLMHVAALAALLGTAGGLGMGIPKLGAVLAGTAERPVAVWMQIGMGLICAVFLALCVKSFIDARRARKAA